MKMQLIAIGLVTSIFSAAAQADLFVCRESSGRKKVTVILSWDEKTQLTGSQIPADLVGHEYISPAKIEIFDKQEYHTSSSKGSQEGFLGSSDVNFSVVSSDKKISMSGYFDELDGVNLTYTNDKNKKVDLEVDCFRPGF